MDWTLDVCDKAALVISENPQHWGCEEANGAGTGKSKVGMVKCCRGQLFLNGIEWQDIHYMSQRRCAKK